MEYSEKWGNSVEAATELALKDLRLTIDEVDVIVLEEPSKGFFGLGSKLAKVRVKKKNEEKQTESKKDAEVEKDLNEKEEEKQTVKNIKKEEFKEITIDYVELELVDEHPAKDFLKDITEKMGLEFQFVVRVNEELVHIDIKGEETGTLIGKRGQTLDSIQYLTSLAINKDCEEYKRVIIDAENYREKREKTLINLSNRLADKVIRTRRSVKLEPMNPYERKIIHSTLQRNGRVITRSEGQDPYRRVVIELK